MPGWNWVPVTIELIRVVKILDIVLICLLPVVLILVDVDHVTSSVWALHEHRHRTAALIRIDTLAVDRQRNVVISKVSHDVRKLDHLVRDVLRLLQLLRVHRLHLLRDPVNRKVDLRAYPLIALSRPWN